MTGILTRLRPNRAIGRACASSRCGSATGRPAYSSSFKDPGVIMDGDQEQLPTTLANGLAVALEQERLAKEERGAVIAQESDRLKSVLLSSVSHHDLRTPLAGIKAAASSLLQKDVHWTEDDREAFLSDINTEADRLNRLVSNLLDLSRIEAGALRPARNGKTSES